MVNRSNKLLPILGVFALMMLGFAGYTAWFSESPQTTSTQLQALPIAPAPDADSPTETVRTLTAQLGEVRTELDTRRKLDEEQRQLLAAQQQATQDALKKKSDEDQGLLSGIMQRIDDLSGRLTLASPQRNPGNGSGEDIPVGLGLDGQETGYTGVNTPTSKTLIWIEPADGVKGGALQQVAAYTQTGGQLLTTGAQQAGDAATEALTGTWEGARASVGQLTDGVAPNGSGEQSKLKPYFTIPRNATLLGATAFTALVGRIPVKGSVTDPLPFKVLVGRENIAASGLMVPPEVDGVVFSGIAVGDLTMRCATGRLTSATFVFQDGTIRTVSVNSSGGNAGGNLTNMPSLGTLSDAQGIPCVSGELITNAPTFLAQRIGVMSLETAAAASAAAQTTTTNNGLAGTTTAVTGSLSRFVVGQTGAAGAAEIRKWLDERQQQSFDAIFIKPGIELVLHIDQEITIDYDPHGRKLRYDQPKTTNRRAHLD